VLAKAAAEVGQAGDPPPVGALRADGREKTTRWKAVSEAAPKPFAITVLALSDVTAVPAAEVVTMKEFAVGTSA
jgi:hypothetical protein